MMRRRMDWDPRYGLDHPTWDGPSGFHYTSAEDAWSAIQQVYGPDSGHIVVKMERIDPTDCNCLVTYDPIKEYHVWVNGSFNGLCGHPVTGSEYVSEPQEGPSERLEPGPGASGPNP